MVLKLYFGKKLLKKGGVMDNILTINNQKDILSQEEIETLLKGFIKLIEKNTEQKVKINIQNNNFKEFDNKKGKYYLPDLSVNTIKNLENLKTCAMKIYNENKQLKKEVEKLQTKVIALRNELLAIKNEI